jgi:ABC-type enterochelin transport system substrate-binding protein
MDIDELLEEARQKATNYGQMYGEKETADDYLKVTYAQLREDAPKGTAPDMDAWVRRQPEYLEAVERKKNAYTKWKTAETYVKLLFAEKDVWTMKKAIERDLDKAHL